MTSIAMRAATIALLSLCLASVVSAKKDKEDEWTNEEDAIWKAADKGLKETWNSWDTEKKRKIPVSKIANIGETSIMKVLNSTIHPTTIMVHMDENLDGNITKREFRSWFEDNLDLALRVGKDWRQGDTNKDGFLTLDEYLKSPMGKHARRKAGKKAAEAEYKRMDVRDSGKVSKDEFTWYVSADDFGSADRNKDGFLTLEEYKKAPFHFHDYDEPSAKTIEREFTESDIDKDGKISITEFNTNLRKAREEDERRDRKEREEDDDNDDDDEDDDDRKKGKEKGKDRKRPHNVKAKAVTPLH